MNTRRIQHVLRRGRSMSTRWHLLLVAPVSAAMIAPVAAAGGMNERIVFASDRADGQRELYVVNADGSGERRLTFNGIVERAPVWSPDGNRIAFAGLANGNWDVYTVGASGHGFGRVTTDPARDDYPQWTEDGRLVFQRGPFECPCAAWIVNANGTHERRLPLSGNVLTPAPSPHGSRLAYATNARGSWSIHVADLDGRHDRAITSGPAAYGDFNPRWSPSGNTVAFLRDDSGADNDLYVAHSDGTSLRRLTNTPDRSEYWPSWTATGTRLLFAAIPTAAGNWRLRTISIADRSEAAVSTSPSAPLVDDFSDGVRDGSLWHAISDPGSTVVEHNGRLDISIAAGSTPGGPFNQVNAHYGSQCALPGDYEFEANYQLLAWPAIGFYASLNAFFASAGIGREATPSGQQYFGWSEFAGAGIPTVDSAGTFRLVRSGSTISTLVRPAGSSAWTLVFEGPVATGDAVYGVGLTAPGEWYDGGAAAVSFDDFHVISGAFKCPDWWNDVAGDVQ